MVTILVAIRNFTIAVLLAWMGFSVAPDNEKEQDSRAVSPSSSAISGLIG